MIFQISLATMTNLKEGNGNVHKLPRVSKPVSSPSNLVSYHSDSLKYVKGDANVYLHLRLL